MDNHKVVIVTGAGSGVGRAAAVMLGELGYDVVLVGRRREKLEQTAEMVVGGNDGVQLLVLDCDVADGEKARQVVDDTLQAFGRVDGIVNCAGIAPMMEMQEISAEICSQCVDTNLSSIVNITSAAWESMKEQGEGVIVNVSSMASIDPFPGFSVYAASKAGVNMFTQCTASEGEAYGIKAVAIAPGAIETEMFRGLFSKEQFPESQTLRPGMVAQVICDCLTGAREFGIGEVIEMRNG